MVMVYKTKCYKKAESKFGFEILLIFKTFNYVLLMVIVILNKIYFISFSQFLTFL